MPARPRNDAAPGCSLRQWLSDCYPWVRLPARAGWRTRPALFGQRILSDRYRPGKRRLKASGAGSILIPGLFAALFKRLVDVLGFLGGDRHLLILLAKLFVHKCQRVVPGRQAFDFILAGFVGD